ncbi:glutaminyl-peptide cyclotransferase [Streptococcus merionis]|uniref:glutaminyl-peptide cyclotransferase n=1 Tax=Streptococcus merionis TaxID=400065 RepID=UPI0035168985
MITKGKIKLLETYKYDEELYTQGIEKIDEVSYVVTSGKYDKSKIGIYTLDSQTFNEKIRFENQIFAEGITRVKDFFWMLSLRENLAFKISTKDWSIIKTTNYEGDGWGIAYDEHRDCLWMTDGSSLIQQRDPYDFTLKKKIMLSNNDIPISMANELECVDGFIYANIWKTSIIIKFDPELGRISEYFDLTPLLNSLQLTKEKYPTLNYLNGIAHVSERKFLITGKHYPISLLIEIED